MAGINIAKMATGNVWSADEIKKLIESVKKKNAWVPQKFQALINFENPRLGLGQNAKRCKLNLDRAYSTRV